MKAKLTALTSLILVTYSCSSDITEPISSFSFRGDTISVLKIGTYDECQVNSKSINSDSVLWDLGDGRLSKDTAFLLSYPKSGVYTLKLTAKNNNGQTSVSAKKVIVLDRVLKKIVINYVQWDSTNMSEPWPRGFKADIYFQMQMFTDDTMSPYGFYSKCPILYTSSTVKNVNNHYYPPIYPAIEIPVSEKIIIDKNLVQFAPGNVNKAYLFSILAKDSSGNNYRLVNNAFYGFGFGITKDDISSNTFIVNQGGYTSYDLICDFE